MMFVFEVAFFGFVSSFYFFVDKFVMCFVCMWRMTKTTDCYFI